MRTPKPLNIQSTERKRHPRNGFSSGTALAEVPEMPELENLIDRLEGSTFQPLVPNSSSVHSENEDEDSPLAGFTFLQREGLQIVNDLQGRVDSSRPVGKFRGDRHATERIADATRDSALPNGKPIQMSQLTITTMSRTTPSRLSEMTSSENMPMAPIEHKTANGTAVAPSDKSESERPELSLARINRSTDGLTTGPAPENNLPNEMHTSRNAPYFYQVPVTREDFPHFLKWPLKSTAEERPTPTRNSRNQMVLYTPRMGTNSQEALDQSVASFDSVPIDSARSRMEGLLDETEKENSTNVKWALCKEYKDSRQKNVKDFETAMTEYFTKDEILKYQNGDMSALPEAGLDSPHHVHRSIRKRRGQQAVIFALIELFGFFVSFESPDHPVLKKLWGALYLLIKVWHIFKQARTSIDFLRFHRQTGISSSWRASRGPSITLAKYASKYDTE